jgi:hypothetical protein
VIVGLLAILALLMKYRHIRLLAKKKTKNIGIFFTSLALIGFAQTHYVASSMITTSSFMVVESQRSQDHQMFFWKQLLKYICTAMSQSWTATNIGPYCLKPKILYKILHT